MTSLNSDCMRHLIQYFDAQTWAKMATVSKTWKQLAYRPSVWANLAWRPTTASHSLFFKKNEIPTNARHIGPPNLLCFQSWLQHKISAHEYNCFTRQFIHSANPEEKIKHMFMYWSKHKPCIHANHHIWTDVFRGRQFLYDMTTSEVLRIYIRVMDEPSSLINPYSEFLSVRIAECLWERPINWNIDDSLVELRKKIKGSEEKLESEVMKLTEKALLPYKQSKVALESRGQVEFNNNERQYNSRGTEMLDSVAFALDPEQTKTL